MDPHDAKISMAHGVDVINSFKVDEHKEVKEEERKKAEAESGEQEKGMFNLDDMGAFFGGGETKTQYEKKKEERTAGVDKFE